MAHASTSVGSISAALLCGGESRRLGFPKEMLRVDGAPLAVRLADRLATVFGNVAIVTGRPDYLSWSSDVPVFADEFGGCGPLGGIHSGLKHIDSERIFFLPVDMPLAHIDFVRSFVERAAAMDAPAVVGRVAGRVQPLFGLYSRALLPAVERALVEERLSVTAYLETAGAAYVDAAEDETRLFADIDRPAHLHLLKEAFTEVEPLPVKTVEMTRSGGRDAQFDTVAEEWPVAVFVNGTRLATTMCLPNALKELALGLLGYLGLVESLDQVWSLAVDNDARRVSVDLNVDVSKIRNAIQLVITSTCGANVYGPKLDDLSERVDKDDFRVRRSHILDTAKRLRSMAPVFERTGCTHQAAWTDGESVRFFFEDIGRHNAVDKIVGAAMLSGRTLQRGAFVTTGRLNSEMVVKALRARVPVLASHGAATTNAIHLAANHGLTLAGFARGGRVNAYTFPERIKDE